jgi:subtilisin family serine protease
VGARRDLGARRLVVISRHLLRRADGPAGIVDTGVDATHEDLAGRVSASSATCLGSCAGGIPTDDDGHGTHVSGIAGAATDNALGVAGLAYASPLIVVRVFPADATQGAALSDVADGILWAAAHGAKVINLSLGATGGSYPTTLCDAVSVAIDSYDAVVVAAAETGSPREHLPRRRPTRPRARARSALLRPIRATSPAASRTTVTRTSSCPRRASTCSRRTRAGTPT